MELTEKVLSIVTSEFNIGEIADIIDIKNISKLMTKEGNFALKATKLSEGNLLYIFEAVEHLRNNGFHNVNKYIKTIKDNPYITIGNSNYVLTEWINGSICDYNNLTQLKSTVQFLAIMHEASKGFAESKKAVPRHETRDWHDSFGERCNDLINFKEIIKRKKERSLFDTLYLSNLDYYYNLGLEVINMLDYTEYNNLFYGYKKERGFCHHDLANHNVIIQNDSAYFIDFDFVYSDIFLHDLSSLIIRNMRTGKWDIEKAWYIIRCYSEITKIRDEDIEVMKQFIKFPQDFWQIGYQYYIEKYPWEEEFYLTRLMRYIVQKQAREHFMNKFKTYKLQHC